MERRLTELRRELREVSDQIGLVIDIKHRNTVHFQFPQRLVRNRDLFLIMRITVIMQWCLKQNIWKRV